MASSDQNTRKPVRSLTTLIDQLRRYRPFNEQEARDGQVILHCLMTEPYIFTRQNPIAHMTASAWVVNAARTKALMAYHNIYASWSWLGGHADGDERLPQVALCEVREESGLCGGRLVSEDIFSLEVLTVDGHVKRNVYVPSHLHLNLTYLIEADDSETLRAKPDENSNVKWFPLEEAVAASSEPWFREHIYSKLNQKLAADATRFNL